MPVWRSPGMPALLLVTFAGFSGYAALISVAPLWAVRGGAGEVGAGLVNAVLLLTTVAAQPLVPGALGRWGYGPVIAAGLAFLGVPALGYGLSDQLPPVLVMSALRGVGFAIITVTGSAVVAKLVPAGRLGAGIGVYGLAVAAPMLVLLPVSVPLADGIGFWAAFVVGGLPLVGIPGAVPLGRAVARSDRPAAGEVGARPELVRESQPRDGELRNGQPWPELLGRLGRPMFILLSVTLAGGALLTFLPQLARSSSLAAGSLFVLSLGAALSRWLVGSLADRTDPRPYLAPLLLLTAAGMAAVAWWVHRAGPSWALLLAVALIGIGYGALQNLTLVVSFQAVRPERVNQASAAWNMGFDAGTGFGSLLTGYLAAGFSFPAAFLTLGAVCVAAVATVRGIAAHRARPDHAR